MMFRKLYWVTEAVDARGTRRLIGVFTSIPNLIKHGLQAETELDLNHVCLTLTRLDTHEGSIRSWTGEAFARLHEDLKPFIASDEFSSEQCSALVSYIEQMKKAAA